MSEVIETKSPEAISEAEQLRLELAKMTLKLASANAETALARNELAALNHRYLILQLYHKYQLTDKDGINEQGQILRDYVKEVPDGSK